MIRIMIVDDQALVRQGLTSLLSEEQGIEVVGEAGNGREAISLIESLKPDVILMDMRMPVCNGVEATQEILERNPEIKILVLTTFDDDEYIFDSLKAGASGYLLKDTEPDVLASAVKAVYQGHTQLGPTVGGKVMARIKPPAKVENTEALKFMTQREREVLQLIAHGQNNKDIANALNITEGTVKHHISKILVQLNVRNRTEAALWARENIS